MPSIITNIMYHLIFSTKGREPLLERDLQHGLYEEIGEIVEHLDGRVLRAGGAPDHIHLLVHWAPEHSIADIQKLIKARSAQWLRGQRPALAEFEWQQGYLGFSVSQSRAEHVILYIANQETHHAKWDFKHEVVILLDANHCEYDEKDMWK